MEKFDVPVHERILRLWDKVAPRILSYCNGDFYNENDVNERVHRGYLYDRVFRGFVM